MTKFLLTMLVCSLGFTACNLGRDLEKYLFEKRNAIYGHCIINNSKYNDAKIYDPHMHGEHPHYSTLERGIFLDTEKSVFLHALLSSPNSDSLDFKYRLYFHIPYDKATWQQEHRYLVKPDQNWENQLPPIFDSLDINRLVKRLGRNTRFCVAVLRDNTTNQEVSLSGELHITPKKVASSTGLIVKYRLKGLWQDQSPLNLEGQSEVWIMHLP